MNLRTVVNYCLWTHDHFPFRAGKHFVTRNRAGPLSKKSLKIGHQKTNCLNVMSSIEHSTVLSRIICGEQHTKRKPKKSFDVGVVMADVVVGCASEWP